MIRALHRRHRRATILRQARTVPPRLRPQFFRTALYSGETDAKLLLALAELALESEDASIPLYIDALRNGRRLKVGHYPIRFLTFDGYDANLIFDIESSFPKETS